MAVHKARLSRRRAALVSATLGSLALVAPSPGPAVRAASVAQPAAQPAAASRDGGRRLCQAYSGLPSASTGGDPLTAGMVWVPRGTFSMGSDHFYREERPLRQVTVGGFWADRTEVTNAQFAAFVAATGYQTVAERRLDPARHPGAAAETLGPGAMIFVEPASARASSLDPGSWWRYVPGASWRHPQGPDSSVVGRENHPVVDVAFADAQAYARWRGHVLPTEAEWEFAARGGIDGADYAWGHELTPGGRWQANAWQGAFPVHDEAADGYHGTAPVGCFPPNGYGAFDMIGNVWEWVTDAYEPGHGAVANGAVDPVGPRLRRSPDPAAPTRVIKGGSWLCASDSCGRYRPSARQPHEEDLGTTHLGFRTILRGHPLSTGRAPHRTSRRPDAERRVRDR